jgi:hypothetical protein
MGGPHARRPPAGPNFTRPGPVRSKPLSVQETPLRTCGVCQQPASQTIRITVAGFAFLKDLCPPHLQDVLEEARERG